MNITPNKPPRFSALELGFRPFFLLAGGAALLLVPLWLWTWHGGATPGAYYGATGWHAHEMLFGYVVAVISGFLLTAVRNWTGRDTAVGAPLGLLALLWLAGRLLPWWPAAHGGLLALVDLAFLPLLAAALAPALWAGENRVNRRFLALLAAMTLANGLIHAQALGWGDALPGAGDLAARGQRLMLDLVMLLLIWVVGRVLPFFTRVAVQGPPPRIRESLERAGMGCLVALAVSHLVGGPALLNALLLLAIAAWQGLRFYDWHQPGVWRIPILWVLFSGLAWLVLATLLQAAAEPGGVPVSVAIHALTAGAFGVFTLGMMARVALGHTGRPMQAHPLLNLAFVLINLAALARSLGPWLLPQGYLVWVMLAGLLWTLAFAAFVWVYTPILLLPRVDRPG